MPQLFSKSPRKKENSLSIANLNYVMNSGLYKVKFASNEAKQRRGGGYGIKAKAIALDPKTNQVLGKVSFMWNYESSDQEDLSYFLNMRDNKGNLYAPDLVNGEYGLTLSEINGRETFALIRFVEERYYNGNPYCVYKLIAFTDNRGYDAFSVDQRAQTPQAHCQEFLMEILKQQQGQQQQQPQPQAQQAQYMGGGNWGAQPQQGQQQPQAQQAQYASQQNFNNDIPF